MMMREERFSACPCVVDFDQMLQPVARAYDSEADLAGSTRFKPMRSNSGTGCNTIRRDRRRGCKFFRHAVAANGTSAISFEIERPERSWGCAG